MKINPSVEDFNVTAMSMLHQMKTCTKKKMKDELEVAENSFTQTINLDIHAGHKSYTEVMHSNPEIPSLILMKDDRFLDMIADKKVLGIDIKAHWEVLCKHECNRDSMYRYLFILNFYSLVLSLPEPAKAVISMLNGGDCECDPDYIIPLSQRCFKLVQDLQNSQEAQNLITDISKG